MIQQTRMHSTTLTWSLTRVVLMAMLACAAALAIGLACAPSAHAQQSADASDGALSTMGGEEVTEATPVIVLSKTSFVYNGKTQKPEVTVRVDGALLPESEYSIAWKTMLDKDTTCKDVGGYKACVTLTGSYTGSAYKEFQIIPKATSIKKITAKKKSITIKWKKGSGQVDSYEVQVSRQKNFAEWFKYRHTNGKNKTKATITGLKPGKKYYVRVRALKGSDENASSSDFLETYRSKWSKVKAVKTKKAKKK